MVWFVRYTQDDIRSIISFINIKNQDAMIHILNKENTILNKFLAQIRDREVQTDSMRFRRNLERKH